MRSRRTPRRCDRPCSYTRRSRMTYPQAVQAELAMLCRELDMDSALVSEIMGGREVVRWAAGAGDYASVSAAREDTICARLLDGRIGPVVTDTKAEPSLNTLAAVRD